MSHLRAVSRGVVLLIKDAGAVLQHLHDEEDTVERDEEIPAAHRHADRRRQPDGRGSGESVDLE